MIELEYTDEEPELVFKKTVQKKPEETQKTLKIESDNPIPAPFQIEIEQHYETTIATLNTSFPEFKTLMPYSCTLTLEDVSLKRYVSFQIIVNYQNDSLENVKLVSFKASNWATMKSNPEIIDFQKNRSEAVRKFTDLFLEMTFNDFEERGNFVENIGKFKLIDNLDFVLHGEKIPSFQEEKNKFLAKSKFVGLKLLSFEQFESENPQLPLEKILNINNLTCLANSLHINDNFFFKLSNSKLLSIWQIVGRLSREFKNNQTRKNLIEESLLELNTLLFENNSSAFFQVSTFFELVDVAKKMRLLADACQYSNFLQDMYNVLSTGATMDQFLENSHIRSHKLDKANDEFEFVSSLFSNNYSHLPANFGATIDSVFSVDLKKYKRRFFPFEKNKRVFLWKAFDFISLASFLNNKCFIYLDEPSETNWPAKSGVSFYDCSSKAIQSLAFPDKHKYFLVLFEVGITEIKSVSNIEQIPLPSLETSMLKISGKWDSELVEDVRGVFYGKGLVQSGLVSQFVYNEFVVFDTHQYLPRFLLFFK